MKELIKTSLEAYKKVSCYNIIPFRILFNIRAIEIDSHNQIPVLIDTKLVNQTIFQLIKHNPGRI